MMMTGGAESSAGRKLSCTFLQTAGPFCSGSSRPRAFSLFSRRSSRSCWSQRSSKASLSPKRITARMAAEISRGMEERKFMVTTETAKYKIAPPAMTTQPSTRSNPFITPPPIEKSILLLYCRGETKAEQEKKSTKNPRGSRQAAIGSASDPPVHLGEREHLPAPVVFSVRLFRRKPGRSIGYRPDTAPGDREDPLVLWLKPPLRFAQTVGFLPAVQAARRWRPSRKGSGLQDDRSAENVFSIF